MVTRIVKALGRALGVDGDDVKVIAVGIIVVLAVGLGLVLLGGFIGLAVAAFELASG